MIDIKLVKSNFDPETGVSYALCSARNYTKSGYAYVHPDDKGKESKFFGCHLADMRAQIAVLKDILKEEKFKCDECRKFVKTLEQYKNWPSRDSEDTTAKIVYRQLNKRISAVNSITDQINYLELEIERYKKGQELVRKKYIDKPKTVNS